MCGKKAPSVTKSAWVEEGDVRVEKGTEVGILFMMGGKAGQQTRHYSAADRIKVCVYYQRRDTQVM